MEEYLLQVKELTKEFTINSGRGRLTAVKELNLELQSGECLGILGGSGSGKSTLAKLILGFLQPTSGKILLQGQDISKFKNPRQLYSRVQLVMQNPQETFDPRYTLGDSIGEALRNYGTPKALVGQRVKELLQQCQLQPEIGARYPHQVSGGQCQRAALARALAVQPQLLICDEATTALDEATQQEIIQLLQELRRQRQNELGVLFICHDIAVARELCDRLIIMHHGEIVEAGSTQQVLEQPQHEYTKALLEAVFW